MQRLDFKPVSCYISATTIHKEETMSRKRQKRNTNQKGKKVKKRINIANFILKVAAFLIIASLAATLMRGKASYRKISPEKMKQLQKKRKSVFTEWKRCAKKIARKSSLPHINHALKKYLSQTGVAQATRRRIEIFAAEIPRENIRIATLPILKEDHNIPAIQRILLYQKGIHLIASLNCKRKVLLIQSEVNLSCTWKGIVFLHEMSHFLSCSNTQTAVEKINDEILARESDNQIMSIVGGPKYASLIKKEAQRIHNRFKRNQKIALSNNLHKEVKNLFGEKALSKEEIFARQTAVQVHAAFTLFDKHYGKSKELKMGLMAMLGY
jgi:hypothetical protein